MTDGPEEECGRSREAESGIGEGGTPQEEEAEEKWEKRGKKGHGNRGIKRAEQRIKIYELRAGKREMCSLWFLK